MKIAVFGATGGTGKQVVQQALAAGDQVTALVRDPAKLAVDSANLTVVTGNVLDAAKVEETLQGADAVVVSLGNTRLQPGLRRFTGHAGGRRHHEAARAAKAHYHR